MLALRFHFQPLCAMLQTSIYIRSVQFGLVHTTCTRLLATNKPLFDWGWRYLFQPKKIHKFHAQFLIHGLERSHPRPCLSLICGRSCVRKSLVALAIVVSIFVLRAGVSPLPTWNQIALNIIWKFITLEHILLHAHHQDRSKKPSNAISRYIKRETPVCKSH